MPQLMKGSRVSRADFTDFQKTQAKANGKAPKMGLSMKKSTITRTKKPDGTISETATPPVEIGSAKDDEEY